MRKLDKDQITTLMLLVGALVCPAACGGGSSPGIVQAQTPMYSDSNINGTYNFVSSSVSLVNNVVVSNSGSFTANGAGQITTGSYATVTPGLSCTGSLSGSYSVNSNGSGSETLTITPDAGSMAAGCGSGVAHFLLAVAVSGDTVAFSDSDNSGALVGVAVK